MPEPLSPVCVRVSGQLGREQIDCCPLFMQNDLRIHGLPCAVLLLLGDGDTPHQLTSFLPSLSLPFSHPKCALEPLQGDNILTT